MCTLDAGNGLTNCLKQADLSEPAQKFLKFPDVNITTYDIDLDYDFWNAGEAARSFGNLQRWMLTVARGTDEILGAVLPEELLDGAPSGFAATGHIGTRYMLRWGWKIH